MRLRSKVAAAAWTCVALALVAPALGQAPPAPHQTRITKLLSEEARRAAGVAQAPAAPPIDTRGYRRGDIVGPIHDGKFGLAVAAGLDNTRYYAQTISDLAAKCPGLGLEARKDEVLPYVFASAYDLIQRLGRGDISRSEGFQLAWVAIAGLNQQWQCQYDPSGLRSREQAQAACNEAAGAPRTFSSLDAAHDVTLLVGRHGCDGPQTRRYADNLFVFLRRAHTAMQFTDRMPAPESPEGRAFAAIFENCTRVAGDNAADEWCGCYVRVLNRIGTPSPVLEALARNPFVDGSYITWVVQNVARGGELYTCERAASRHDTWRSNYAPRTTACLISDNATATGGRTCAYRAAWGDFVMAAGQCPASLNSRRWGFREVDCGRGGSVAAAQPGPREWQDGVYTMIDYEHSVPADFTPPIPADAESKVPLNIRLRARDAPGLLRSVEVTPPLPLHFGAGLPRPIQDAIAPDLAALQQEKQLVLACSYRAAPGAVRRHVYWFRRAPRLLSDRSRMAMLRPHPFDAVAGVASRCPAADPQRR
jgi:hypothetical protein